MHARAVLLPATAFAAAWGIARWWPASSVAVDPAAPSSEIAASPAASGNSPSPPLPAPPGMDEVFAATGLERTLLAARFLRAATVPQLIEFLGRAKAPPLPYDLPERAWERLVELDLAAAFRLPDNRFAAWRAWAKLDPRAALAAALTEAPEILTQVVAVLARREPAQARRLLTEHPEISPDLVLQNISEGLLRTDPAAAVTQSVERGPGMQEYVFQQWLRQDPDAARDWARSLTHPGDRRRLGDVALAELAATDPAAALREAQALPAGSRRTGHLLTAITALGRQDPAAAHAAAEGITAPGPRQQALAVLAEALIATDPAAAGMLPLFDWKALDEAATVRWSYTTAEGMRSSGGTSQLYGNTTAELVAKLAASAPRATVEALAALPGEAGAPLSAALGAWVGLAPEAASTWLRDLPPGTAKDNGVEGLVTWLVEKGPERDFPAAMSWAEEASPERRDGILVRALAQWRNADPAGARAAAESLFLTLPEDRRPALRQFLQ